MLHCLWREECFVRSSQVAGFRDESAAQCQKQGRLLWPYSWLRGSRITVLISGRRPFAAGANPSKKKPGKERRPSREELGQSRLLGVSREDSGGRLPLQRGGELPVQPLWVELGCFLQGYFHQQLEAAEVLSKELGWRRRGCVEESIRGTGSICPGQKGQGVARCTQLRLLGVRIQLNPLECRLLLLITRHNSQVAGKRLCCVADHGGAHRHWQHLGGGGGRGGRRHHQQAGAGDRATGQCYVVGFGASTGNGELVGVLAVLPQHVRKKPAPGVDEPIADLQGEGGKVARLEHSTMITGVAPQLKR